MIGGAGSVVPATHDRCVLGGRARFVACPRSAEPVGCLPVERDGNAQWPLQTINDTAVTVSGTCLAGYAGTPTRQCLPGGQWGPVQNPCRGQRARLAAWYGE